MKRDKFDLCESCQIRKEDKCSIHRKNPSAIVLDCGRYRPDQDVTNFMQAATKVMENR